MGGTELLNKLPGLMIYLKEIYPKTEINSENVQRLFSNTHFNKEPNDTLILKTVMFS